MSTAPVTAIAAEGNPPPLPRRGRRIGLLVAGASLLCATAALAMLLLVSTASDGETSVLIGTLDSDRLAALALGIALAALSVGLCVIPVGRAWLLLLIPARIVAIGATALTGAMWILTSSATVVPLVAAGCETGYVVEEESFLFAAWGTVYRRDGLLVTAVDQFTADDGYHPFADGAYTVVDTGDSLDVWYSFAVDYSATPVSADGDPAFTVPKLTDRTLSCGVSTGARTPIPPAPATPTYDADEARAGLQNMIAASLEAAVGPVRDSSGGLLDPAELSVVATACGEDGSRSGLGFTFATADNGSSLARILQVWDAEGYSPDQAMQEDIRYSDALPVEKMSIRDSTTIDGLIHMQLSSQCSVD
ncbi:hypothetical protein LQ938_02505 [Microbacterium sp. cx-55]|uniref:hypothetical protein n=1 Tax=Microbacterium sp. cx-55 TaxID=2875948 RepID=UPI001CBCA1C7|nr:hypothetical protein [Microbacterium sp. cx-55]MBZ4487678.1 hypothetical protein [Microbacterium sp. cx-55]UGB35690.1 hypothetical protein LQ938_02505 [Microbacterium sp. cx-55]